MPKTARVSLAPILEVEKMYFMSLTAALLTLVEGYWFKDNLHLNCLIIKVISKVIEIEINHAFLQDKGLPARRQMKTFASFNETVQYILIAGC